MYGLSEAGIFIFPPLRASELIAAWKRAYGDGVAFSAYEDEYDWRNA